MSTPIFYRRVLKKVQKFKKNLEFEGASLKRKIFNFFLWPFFAIIMFQNQFHIQGLEKIGEFETKIPTMKISRPYPTPTPSSEVNGFFRNEFLFYLIFKRIQYSKLAGMIIPTKGHSWTFLKIFLEWSLIWKWKISCSLKNAKIWKYKWTQIFCSFSWIEYFWL